MDAHTVVLTLHTAAFTVLVGGIVLFDLRLLGLSRQIPVRALSRHILPWTFLALSLVVPSGLALYSEHGAELLGSRVFQLKMGLVLAAGLNAAFFRTGPWQTVAAWDTGVAAPLAARASAALSIVLWFSVIACGRMVAALLRA
jgi:hypothetical protein